MGERTNVGYVITDSIHINGREFVLAHNSNKSSPYVTWECTNGNDYFFGHYFSNMKNAQKDLVKRAYEEVKFMEMNEKNTHDRSER